MCVQHGKAQWHRWRQISKISRRIGQQQDREGRTDETQQWGMRLSSGNVYIYYFTCAVSTTCVPSTKMYSQGRIIYTYVVHTIRKDTNTNSSSPASGGAPDVDCKKYSLGATRVCHHHQCVYRLKRPINKSRRNKNILWSETAQFFWFCQLDDLASGSQTMCVVFQIA